MAHKGSLVLSSRGCFYVHKINVRFVYIYKLCKNICNQEQARTY